MQPVTIEELCAASGGYVSVPDDLGTVDWNGGGRCHNWRTHVPDAIAERWHRLSPDARACVYYMAEQAAGEEQWEYAGPLPAHHELLPFSPEVPHATPQRIRSPQPRIHG